MLTIVASPSPVQVILLSDHVCLARLRFTSFFARLFTLSCLGTHLNYVWCHLFHSGSFISLSVSLFFLADCLQYISESEKSSV